jgi:hypothetical protein
MKSPWCKKIRGVFVGPAARVIASFFTSPHDVAMNISAGHEASEETAVMPVLGGC